MLAVLDISLTQGAVLFGAVCCLAVAFRTLHFPDLTVEGSLPIGAAGAAVALQHGVHPAAALAVAAVMGSLAGAATAVLHARFRVNKFVAGILVVAACYSLTLRVMGGSNLSLLRTASVLDVIDELDRGHIVNIGMHPWRIAATTVVAAVLGLVIVWWLGSRVGLSMRAAAANAEFAAEHGLRRTPLLVVALGLCNAMAGFAGALLAMVQGFSDVGMGQGFVVLCLAALSIGEVVVPTRVLPRHVYVVLAAFVGSVGYQLVTTAAIRFGVPATDLRIATALLVLVVLLTRWRSAPLEALE